jgi:DNA replication protein DnaC
MSVATDQKTRRACPRCGGLESPIIEYSSGNMMCQKCDDEMFAEPKSTTVDLLKRISIPDLLLEARFKTFECPSERVGASVTAFRSWRGQPPLAVISGETGAGKSHLAASYVAAEVSRGVHWSGLRWWSSYDWLAATGVFDNRYRLQTGFAAAKLIVFDDFGAGNMTPAAIETCVGPLIDRIDRGRATIITTNLTQNAIRDLSERLASRTHQALVINLAGVPDYRKGAK